MSLSSTEAVSLSWRLKTAARAWFGAVAFLVVIQCVMAMSIVLWVKHDTTMWLCSTKADAYEVRHFGERVTHGYGATLTSLERIADHPNCPAGNYEIRFSADLPIWIMADLREAVTTGRPTIGLSGYGLSYRSYMSPRFSTFAAFLAALVISVVVWWRTRNSHFNLEPRVGRSDLGFSLAVLVLSMLAAGIYGHVLMSHFGFSTASLNESSPILIFVLLVLAPVAEEVAFRYWLLNRLQAALGAPIALSVSTFAFAVAHVEFDALHLGVRLIAGVSLGLIWIRTRSLATCITAHAVWNVPAAVYVYMASA